MASNYDFSLPPDVMWSFPFLQQFSMCEAHIAIVHQNSLPPRQAALHVRGLFTVEQRRLPVKSCLNTVVTLCKSNEAVWVSG